MLFNRPAGHDNIRHRQAPKRDLSDRITPESAKRGGMGGQGVASEASEWFRIPGQP